MRFVSIAHLKDGDTLAKAVINSQGKILLHAGVQLSEAYIQRLQRMGFQAVYIVDERLEDVVRHQTIRAETLELTYKTIVSVAKCLEHDENILPIDQLRKTIGRVVEDLLSCQDVVLNLSEIKSHDENTYTHSVHTTIIGLSLGLALNLPVQRLTELGIGLIMHDVGKTKIPQNVLNKKEKLTQEEFEIIKEHATLGFEILRKNRDVNLLCAHVAFQHHERWDGCGYPRGLKGREIHEYAAIGAVADVYEALTSWRVYRGPMEPYQAYEYIVGNTETHFAPRVVKVFQKHAVIYPNGSGVVLSSGQRGNVITQSHGFPQRPRVRIFFQGEEELCEPVEYDLLEHPSLIIVKVDNR
ncbi:MAG: HD-GYP domain-containing protein [Peptococcaceae bacterium]|nr:HD-GYP domain-containing protein [Peptococcaceae bacterium]